MKLCNHLVQPTSRSKKDGQESQGQTGRVRGRPLSSQGQPGSREQRGQPDGHRGRQDSQEATGAGAARRSQMASESQMLPDTNSDKEKCHISVRNLKLIILRKSRGKPGGPEGLFNEN